MNKTELLAVSKRVGGFCKTTKMPDISWSLSPHSCNVGGKLSEIDGSVCAKCYAKRGMSQYPTGKAADQRRMDIWLKAKAEGKILDWIDDFIVALGLMKTPYFRWFDRGDIESLAMLKAIAIIARIKYDVLFLLPTKEYGILKQFIEEGYTIPDNLIIRVSAPMIDQKNPPRIKGIHNYSIVTTRLDVPGNACPAVQDHSGCADVGCFRCWDKDTDVVYYPLHVGHRVMAE